MTHGGEEEILLSDRALNEQNPIITTILFKVTRTIQSVRVYHRRRIDAGGRRVRAGGWASGELSGGRSSDGTADE